MAIAFSDEVYAKCQDMFSVDCTFTPLVSGGAPYAARGIYDTEPLDVMAEDGAIFSDQQTVFYIREKEFPVLPVQGDQVNIPFDCNGQPLGLYEILDADTNGGGETQLLLRKIVVSKP